MRSIYKSDTGRAAVHAIYRRALERWPSANIQLMVPTRQGETFVIASGPPDAPPLVLFHGSGANSSIWMREVAAWGREHRLYAVDMIGEPGFSAPARPSLASDAYASWLDDVWNGLSLKQASIVGVSLGGWLALDYAVRRPERVAALSLISPSGVGRQNHAALLKAGVLLACGSWGRRRALGLVSGGHEVPREVADFVLAVFQHFRPRLERLPLFTDPQLAALTMPVQLIVGGHDALIRSSETRARMARLVHDLHPIYVEGGGHILHGHTDAVQDFLRVRQTSVLQNARGHPWND